MPYHNLTKKELVFIKTMFSNHSSDWIKFNPNHCYSAFLEKVMAKIDNMIETVDDKPYECPHENTYWILDQKVCGDCGRMIWD